MQLTFLMIGCCLFPFLMTALGAAAVFLCPTGMHDTARRCFLGFAAGVMLAASVWSLLNPAIAASEALGLPGWLPPSVGLSCGVLFLLLADLAVSHIRLRENRTILPARNPEHNHAFTNVTSKKGNPPVRTQSGGTFLLQLAMTVHNIPEGMAVGLSVALAAETLAAAGGFSFHSLFFGGFADHAAGGELMAALALSLGIGIQNLPEGAAVSLPLRQTGLSSWRAFLRGCLSGIVEPIFGLLTAFLLSESRAVMPWLLSFAAGAMLYVVVCELIPTANGRSESELPAHSGASFIGTLSTAAGFLLMMILDVALG